MRRLALAALAAAVGLSGPAAAATQVKIGHVAPPFHGQHQGMLRFAEVVKEETKGAYEVQVFPLGQLGGERSMAEQVQMGTLQAASITTAVLSNFVPQAAALDLPFLWPDRKTAYAVLDDAEFQAKLFGYFPAKGFTVIGYTENEFRHLNNTKRPIRKPEDLAGLKLRLMEAPIFLDSFKQLGAVPVPMPFPEIYSALQQGVIDAQDNPYYTSVLMKFTEVAKYVTLTNHALTECLIVINNDFWNGLKPEVQQAFRKAAREGIETNRRVTAEQFKKLPKLDISLEEYAKQQNLQVIELTAQERASFKAAMRPVYEKYRPQVGEEFFDFLLKKVEQHA
ncbi:MAG: TRAP transporter substrate-binding protein DctP, partial [Deferrisomatales bacterium]